MSARHAAAFVSTDRPTRRFLPAPSLAAGPSGSRLHRDRRTARQSAGEPKRRGLEVSSAGRLGDAIAPAALPFGRGKSEPELFLQGSREDAGHGMTLPTGHARHLVDRCPLGQTQHRNQYILLRGGLQLRLRLGVRQGLDCRPKLIDQRLAVANLLSLFDTGQSVPQRQQPLGAERSSVQLHIRCNGKLAVIDSPRRLAAQRDSVLPDDVDAHEWGLLIYPAAVPRDLTHALFADQSHSFPDNLVALLGQIGAWNYSADTARSAGSLFASQRVRKLNRARLTRWHPVGGGSLSRLGRVPRGRLRRLSCAVAEGPAQPEMALTGGARRLQTFQLLKADRQCCGRGGC